MRTRTNIILSSLLASILFAGEYSQLLAAQNSVGGGANGASVNVTATVLGVGANVFVPTVAPVTLPPQGGSTSNQVASVNVQLGVPGVLTVLSTGLVVNTTSGTILSSAAHAESSSTVNNLNILNGLVTASTVRAKSTSDGNGAAATSTAAGSFLNQLRISGVLQGQTQFAPNTTIAINASVTAIVGGLPVSVPVSGSLVLNEQSPGGNGLTTSSLTVNYIHLSVSGSVAGQISLNADVIVASATSSVDFTAAQANNPPLITVPGSQTVQVGNTLTFSASAADPDNGDVVTLSATTLPPGSSFSPNPATGNPASGQFSFTPSQSQAGQTFVVNFSASDNHGAQASASVQITVTSGPPANRPPVVTVPGSQTVQVGATLNFNASGSDPDAGDTVTFTASSIPANATVTPNPATGNPASSQFHFVPSQSQAGQTFAVNFTAVDNHGAQASGSVQITVTNAPPPANRPPVISVPGPQVIAVGDALTFMVTASDPDGDAVALSATSVPANASFNANTGGFAFTPTSNQAGQVFVVMFTATDPQGASASATVQITVIQSAGGGELGPPIISVPPSPIVVPVGTTLTFIVIGSSPGQGCHVALSARDLPANGLFDPPSGRFDFTPVEQQIGESFVSTFIATDCIGQTATGTVTIVVVAAGGGGGGGGGTLPPGHICVPVTKVFFKTIPANGGCGFIKISLASVGGGPLKIRSMGLVDGTHFRVEGMPTLPASLQSASVLELTIMFQPKGAGNVSDTLVIDTDDPDNPTITVKLKGKGKR
jgi:hypothetical protein